MKKHARFKKLLSCGLALALTVSLLPAVPAEAASGSVTAPPVDMGGIALLNAQTMYDPDFFAEYVRKSSAFNMIGLFENDFAGRLSPSVYVAPKVTGGTGDTLSYDSSFTRKSNDKVWQGLYSAGREKFGDLIGNEVDESKQDNESKKVNEIKYNFSASLKRDYHANLINHPGKQSDMARVELFDNYGYVNGRLIKDYQNLSSDPNRTFVDYGNEDAKNWMPLALEAGHTLDLKFGSNENCTCGSSAVRNMSFVLADDTLPTIKQITVSADAAGSEPKTSFKLNDTGYVTLHFSEKIRFASETAPALGAIKLNLTTVSRINNAGVTNGFSATLVELGTDTMVFEFTVPETLDGKPAEQDGKNVTDYQITGIQSKAGSDAPDQDTWIRQDGDNAFELTLYGRDSKPVELKSKQKTNSLVTDMAGNPINWTGSTKVLTDFYIDAKAPKVEKVELVGSMISQDSYRTPENGEWPPDIDRGAVFAGAGDSFRAVVTFNEELAPMDWSTTLLYIIATFNFQNNVYHPEDKKWYYEPVIARALYAYVESNGTRPVTKLVFGLTQIGGSRPSESPAPIAITSLSFPTDKNGVSTVTDVAGNPIAAEIADLELPREQLWIDTCPPSASLMLPTVGGSDLYEPLRYDDGGDDVNSFYIPIQVQDNGDLNNPAYTSGITDLKGTFGLETGMRPYRYAVRSGPDGALRPAEEDYTTGYSGSFPQLPGGNTVYLHFQLIDGVDYNFKTLKALVNVRDYARNSASIAWTLNQKGDGTPPLIDFSSVVKTYAPGDQSSVAITVKVSDYASDLGAVEYSWGLGEADWNTPENEAEEGQPFTFTVTQEGLADSETHSGTLSVRAFDTEGNERTATKDYTYDLVGAAYSYELGFDPELLLGNYPDYTGNIGGYAHPITVQAPPLYAGDDDNIDKTATTTLFLLEDQLTEAPDDYFVRAFTSRSEGVSDQGGLVYHDNQSGTWVTDGWFHATYSKTAENYEFGDSTPVTDDADLAQNLDTLWRSFYGEQHAILLTAYGDHSAFGGTTIPTASTSLEELEFRTASYTEQFGGSRSPNTVTFGAPKDPDGTPNDLRAGTEEYDPNTDDTPRVLRSLSGAQLPFTVRNEFIPEWGVDDVDFERSTVTLTYMGKTGDHPTWECSFPLEPGREDQTFVFPSEIPDGPANGGTEDVPRAYETGYYTVTVTVDVLGAGRNNYNSNADRMQTKAKYEDIFLYMEEPTEFGMSDYYLSTGYGTTNLHTFARVTTDTSELPEGYYFTNVKLGSYEEPGFTRERYLSFGVKGLPDYSEGYSEVYWKFWNADDPAGESRASYSALGPFDRAAVRLVDGPITEDDYDPTTDLGLSTYPTVPVLKNQEENTICYRFVLQNGYVSPVRQVTAYVRGGQPMLEVSVSPEAPEDGGQVNGASLSFAKASSPNGAIISYAVAGKTSWTAYEPFVQSITESGTYRAFICDEFGNATMVKREINYVDGVGPDVFFTKLGGIPEGEFGYTVTIGDDRPITAGRLYISQVDGKDGTHVTQGEVPIPNNVNDIWRASSFQPSGVYESKLISPCTYNESLERYELGLEIKGVCPYLADVPDTSPARWINFSASDDMGNLSTMTTDTGMNSGFNTKPTCTGTKYGESDGLTLTFNSPVRKGPGAVFSHSLTGLPIYRDGKHVITYYDLFGNKYTQEIDVTAFDGLGLEVDWSEDQPTRDNVTLSIAAIEGSVITGITAVPDGVVDHTVAADGGSATATVRENAELRVGVKSAGDGQKTKVFFIRVDNIDRVLEPAEIRYTYASPPVAGETTGDVTASLFCEEEVEGLSGEALTYTFTLDGPTTHTFVYRDMAGNQGSLTAVCPVRIVPDPNAVDPKKPPAFSVELKKGLRGLYSTVGRYPDDDGDISLTLEPAQSYVFYFESPVRGVKLFVSEQDTAEAPDYQSGVSAEIAGVTAAGMTVTVKANASFKVWLVDRWGNSAALLIPAGQIDNTPPTGTVAYRLMPGSKTVRAYLKPDGEETVTVVNKAGVAQETEPSEYQNLWYHDFTENGTFLFALEDAVGNAGTVEAKVVTLDTTAPVVLGEAKWSGELEKPTNRPISAQFILSKNIRNVEAAWTGPETGDGDVTEHITVQLAGSTATVTYLKNTPALTLTFKALNGLTCTAKLPAVGNMDLTPPEISEGPAVALSANKRTATISFKTGEAVMCAQAPKFGGDGQPVYETEFSFTVQANGTYTIDLTDAAGNWGTGSAEVTGIDRDVLTLTYRKGTNGTEEPYAFRLGRLKNGDTVYVKANKAVDVVYTTGETTSHPQSVAADTWVATPFTIAEGSASYAITATDKREDKVTAYLDVLPPDTLPPVLLLKAPTLPIAMDSSADDLRTAILGNLTVTDDRSARDKITLDVETNGVTLSQTGLYMATVTATDEKGNQSEPISVPVRVYGPEDLYAQIGDTLVFPNSTVVVNETSLTIQLYNLPEGEPYTIRYKAGYKTTGQMKIGSTPVVDGVLRLKQEQYYTIYVRTQSRKELLFYVYVGQ